MKLCSLKLFLLCSFALAFTAHAQQRLDLIGNTSWSISGSRITIQADQIENSRAVGSSGKLRLQIWATAAPYDGTNDIVGFVIGSAKLSPLDAQSSKFNVSKRVRYHAPPPDYYYTTITLEEEFPDGSWQIEDFEIFAGVVNLGGYGEGAVNLTKSSVSDISFLGDVSWLSGNKKVQLYAERICNQRPSGRSGSLRVRLFASDLPYDPVEVFYAYPLATKSAGRLYAQSVIEFYPKLTSFKPPPAGEWFITITLEEYNYGWIIRDYYTFLDPRLF